MKGFDRKFFTEREKTRIHDDTVDTSMSMAELNKELTSYGVDVPITEDMPDRHLCLLAVYEYTRLGIPAPLLDELLRRIQHPPIQAGAEPTTIEEHNKLLEDAVPYTEGAATYKKLPGNFLYILNQRTGKYEFCGGYTVEPKGRKS
jgi:hypothetical protein